MSAEHALRQPHPGPTWVGQTTLEDLHATQRLAEQLAAQLDAGDLLVLTGGLGAGKTTFTQALAAALGVQDQVSSPTFVLSRIHRSLTGGPDLVHVDAYRTDEAGLESLDLLATADAAITVVEWGRGLAEQQLAAAQGSWLDLELIHTLSTAAKQTESDADGEIITDFTETEEDLQGTPRTAVLRGYGTRWPQPLL